MAKQKSEVNKSALVREVSETNPLTPLKEITSTLAKQGVKVSDNLIYSLKSQMKNKKQKAK